MQPVRVQAGGGAQIIPEWHGSLRHVNGIEKSPNVPAERAGFLVKMDGAAAVLGADGALRASAETGELSSFSADGNYFIKFQKVGSEIEFFSLLPALNRFWKIKSFEYPYLSPHGKLILLLNSDQSAIRMIDNSGNETGERSVAGFLCTVIAFAERSDFGAAGFMSGGYFFVGPGGKVIGSGTLPTGCAVKGLA